MKQLLNRIKDAWCILTSRRNFCVFFTDYKTVSYENTYVDLRCFILRAVDQLYRSGGYTESDFARYQMIESILNERSVILLSIPGDIPTITYDCASDEDFQVLAAVNID